MECPNANESCRFYEQGCFSNVHHKYFPKKLYRDSVGRIFRELPENKVRMCANEHVELHSTEAPQLKNLERTLIIMLLEATHTE